MFSAMSISFTRKYGKIAFVFNKKIPEECMRFSFHWKTYTSSVLHGE